MLETCDDEIWHKIICLDLKRFRDKLNFNGDCTSFGGSLLAVAYAAAALWRFTYKTPDGSLWAAISDLLFCSLFRVLRRLAPTCAAVTLALCATSVVASAWLHLTSKLFRATLRSSEH